VLVSCLLVHLLLLCTVVGFHSLLVVVIFLLRQFVHTRLLVTFEARPLHPPLAEHTPPQLTPLQLSRHSKSRLLYPLLQCADEHASLVSEPPMSFEQRPHYAIPARTDIATHESE
jgi:hypothetical protein